MWNEVLPKLCWLAVDISMAEGSLFSTRKSKAREAESGKVARTAINKVLTMDRKLRPSSRCTSPVSQ